MTVKAQNPAYRSDGTKETDLNKLTNFTGTFSTIEGNSGDSSFKPDKTVVIDGFALSGNGLKIGAANYNTVGNLTVCNCTMSLDENKSTSRFIYVNGGETQVGKLHQRAVWNLCGGKQLH